MVARILAMIWSGEQLKQEGSGEFELQLVYKPEPPMGFVRRSDPNFYFLSRSRSN